MTPEELASSAGRVEASSVSKSYGSTPVLFDIDLSVATGELVVLVGPSGCGKSTLLRIIAGLVQPTAGTVSIGGEDPQAARRTHRIAFAFQHSGLLEWRDVAANVELPLQIAGWSARERHDRVDELLNLVGLRGVAAQPVWELSGGMQQRVALARALATRPAVLLLDEPFAALDEMTRERLQDELLAVRSTTGVTIVLVTHSVSEAAYLGDRTVVLSARPGRIAGVISTLHASQRVARVDPSYAATATAIRAVLAAGVDEARP